MYISKQNFVSFLDNKKETIFHSLSQPILETIEFVRKATKNVVIFQTYFGLLFSDVEFRAPLRDSKLHFLKERLAEGLSRDPPVPHLDNAGGDPPFDSLFLLLNLFIELARLRLLDRVMRGSGTGFFSSSPSHDLRVKFFKHLIFEVVFSEAVEITMGIGSLDLLVFSFLG